MFRARVGVLLAAVMACLGVACGASSGGADAGSSDYGSYQIDPGHSGYISGGKLKPPLMQLWNPLPALGGSTFPVVVSGVLYVVIFPNPGSDLGELYAVNTSTGNNVWPPVFVANASALAVGDGVVVVNTTSGVVRAFKTSDGTELWNEIVPTTSVLPCAPIISDGTAYIANGDGNVWALSDADGSVIWNSATAQATTVTAVDPLTEGSAYISGPMAVANGLVFGQTTSASVNALESGSGKLVWTVSLSGNAGWAPAVFGSQAAVSSTSGSSGTSAGGLLLDLSQGTQADSALFFISTRSPVSDGTLGYVVDGSTGTLTATNLSNNSLSWVFSAPNDPGLTGEPLLVNGVIYTTSAATGTIYGVSTGGKGLWSDSSLAWVDPSAAGTMQNVPSLQWGTMGSDGNVLAVATTTSIAVYGSN